MSQLVCTAKVSVFTLTLTGLRAKSLAGVDRVPQMPADHMLPAFLQVAEAEAAAVAGRDEAAAMREALQAAEAARDVAAGEAAATADALRAAEARLADVNSRAAQLESQLAEASALHQARVCCAPVQLTVLLCQIERL